MFANDLISNETPQVRLTDLCGTVLDWMDEYDVLHLPVFEGNNFQGLISQSCLQDHPEEMSLDKMNNALLDIHVTLEAHMFDVVKLMNAASLSLVPVFKNEDEFLGVIRYVDIIKSLGASAAAKQPGALLELQMTNADYSMSDIARIIEGNDAKILYSNVVRLEETKDIKVYLKLNTLDVSGVLQTFSRYDYKVKSSVQDTEYEEDLRDRFDSLMNYLNM
ncbi:MAG: acetoin utilization protein AcuB [Glaciecola sp.]|jgi:acetoin utilization protein AcuB